MAAGTKQGKSDPTATLADEPDVEAPVCPECEKGTMTGDDHVLVCSACGFEERDDDVVEVDAVEVDEAGAPVPEAVVSQEVAIIEERAREQLPAHVLPSTGEWAATIKIANEIAGTEFVPTSYRNNPASVVAAILTGREMGIGPMQSLKQIHMIDGRAAFSAELMLAQMRKGGVVILASESTRERAMIHARRRDTGEEATVEWTIGEAKDAGLLGKKGWEKYPADMLWARCVGRLARRLGSDLLNGMVYSSEEMQDWDTDDDADNTTKPKAKPKIATSQGVEARADAPRSWRAIADALNNVDPADTIAWPTWIGQAVHALAGVDKVSELPEGDVARDTIILVANGVANLVEQRAGAEMPPVTRAEVRDAFAKPNSVGEVLEGPAWRLSPDEDDRPTKQEHDDQVALLEGTQDAPGDAVSAEEPKTRRRGKAEPQNAAQDVDNVDSEATLLDEAAREAAASDIDWPGEAP